MLTREQAVKAFGIMTECFYRAGVLYTTSEKGEGYLAYWRKRVKPAMSPALHMIKRFLCELPPKAWMAVAGSGGDQYAKVFKKERDYVVVSMIVVLLPFLCQKFYNPVNPLINYILRCFQCISAV